MRGRDLAVHRHNKMMTQENAAKRLGVSQTYLSLLEADKRPVTARLVRRATSVFGLSPSTLPTRFGPAFVTDDKIAMDLARLGYPGFSHLKKRTNLENPTVILFAALNADKRDTRLMEALPWLLVKFPDLDWTALVMEIKAFDLQNRLGFLTAVAKDLATQNGNDRAAAELSRRERELSSSLLVREDTLCNETMTDVEREWLLSNRPPNAKRWRVLTDMRAQLLNNYE